MASDTAFLGRVPELYDQYLGPMIFAPYADDLARRLSDLRAGSVLETACGTGIVTRRLAQSLASSVAIVATDLQQAMIGRAMTKPGLERVTWQQADALALPFPDATFDAVVCQFGVMFLPDRPAGYREARRVLKPGGRFLFSVWDEIATQPIADVVVSAMLRRYPSDPPRFLARTPHGYHDTGVIRADLAAAEFTDIVVETLELLSRAATYRDPAIGFCQGTPMRGEIEARDPGGLQAATDAAADALAERFGTGAIEAPMRAHVVTVVR